MVHDLSVLELWCTTYRFWPFPFFSIPDFVRFVQLISFVSGGSLDFCALKVYGPDMHKRTSASVLKGASVDADTFVLSV